MGALQTVLPFKLAATDEELTAHGGLAPDLFAERSPWRYPAIASNRADALEIFAMFRERCAQILAEGDFVPETS